MGLVVILVSTVVAMSAMAQLWEDEWEVLLISLQVRRGGGAPLKHAKQGSMCLYPIVSSDQDPEREEGPRRARRVTEEGGDRPGSLTPSVSGVPAPWIEMGHQGVGDQRVWHSWDSVGPLVPSPRTQGTAPFLHMGALATVTVLSWIVAGQFARAERSCECDWAEPAPGPALPAPQARHPLDVPYGAMGTMGAAASVSSARFLI